MINRLDKIRYQFSYGLFLLVRKTKITPNQVTVFRFVVTAPLCIYFFSRGEYLYNVIGLLLYIILSALDWVDGLLARDSWRATTLGRFLDHGLDRFLVYIVLGSIFYGNFNYYNSWSWAVLAVLFYSAMFLVSWVQLDFDRFFHLEFERYPEVRAKIKELNLPLSFSDRLLLNFLNVHHNSLAKFCFCLSYPLTVGIIFNQLFAAFVFMTVMLYIRIFGINYIIYRALRPKDKPSSLTTVLRYFLSSDNQ